MTIEDFLRRVVAALENAEVPYMVTGSYASSAHGVPRASHDIDIVIAPAPDQLRALLRELPPERYYADEIEAFDALEQSSLFNIIDFATAWKADLIVRKNRAFSAAEFERRRVHTIAGVRVHVATAEDILIAKLEWYTLGGSERQLDDAAGIIERQRGALDRPYIARWVRELDLTEAWQIALAKAGE